MANAVAVGPEEWLFFAVALGAGALAVLVLAVAPGRTTNRALALFLALLGANYALDALTDAAAGDLLSYNLAFFTVISWPLAVLAYLGFIGAALDTPLVRPLRSRAGRWTLVAAGVMLALATRQAFVAAGDASRGASGKWDLGSAGLLVSATGVGIALALLFGLAASVHAFSRASPGSPARSRARAYAIAFGIQDVGLAIASVLDAVGGLTGAAYSIVYSLPVIAFLPLLAVGLLRYQLFDFDLKLKWTLRRGTLVGVFLGAFFVVAAIVEQYLQQYGVLVGGAAVGVMLFALRPLERAADRIANAAMPRVQDTEEYRIVRKREVYRAAVESALEDGDVTEKERAMLATLQDQLGLTASEALRLEREAREGVTV